MDNAAEIIVPRAESEGLAALDLAIKCVPF